MVWWTASAFAVGFLSGIFVCYKFSNRSGEMDTEDSIELLRSKGYNIYVPGHKVEEAD